MNFYDNKYTAWLASVKVGDIVCTTRWVRRGSASLGHEEAQAKGEVQAIRDIEVAL